MAEVLLAVGFSLSTGALIVFAVFGLIRVPPVSRRVLRRRSSPDCLGQIREKNCEYCSTVCPLAYRCALIAMDEYIRRNPGLISSQDPSEQL
jgi:hypothetical protein